MKCAHLIAHKGILACSGLGKPYVSSLFDLVEYCETIDYRNCPSYLRRIICVSQAEDITDKASLYSGFFFVM